ncbi:MAG: baseplate j family protein, partial [Clostridia bacterium]|nr:baseplate j family protein [Clostridia bacterium]
MSDSLARMKGRVTGYQVHEGSYLHDAFAPVALELDTIVDQTLPAALDAHMPDTAAGADLDRVAAAYGVARKAAVYAVGEVTVTGLPATEIAQNVPISTRGGTIFLTDAVATIPTGGVVIIPVTAAQAGSAGNVAAGTVTVLPIGVAGVYEATNAQPMVGGADVESDTSLRERLLMKLRLPSASGTESD